MICVCVCVCAAPIGVCRLKMDCEADDKALVVVSPTSSEAKFHFPLEPYSDCVVVDMCRLLCVLRWQTSHNKCATKTTRKKKQKRTNPSPRTHKVCTSLFAAGLFADCSINKRTCLQRRPNNHLKWFVVLIQCRSTRPALWLMTRISAVAASTSDLLLAWPNSQ